ncbi:PhzF family phenazine biosynthesis protein [Exiguobacterium acetylicum]|nr:PhzF family phenazine biosynthesis protein [Exiguobacterium acetylicum]
MFTSTPGSGNPAGVVLDANQLSELEMQRIARANGFTETTFVLTSDQADYRMRYFAPDREMNLCGHGTIAALTALETTGRLPMTLQIETKSGTLPASRLANGMFRLQQGRPELQPFEGKIDRVLASIGLELKHLDDRWPVVYGSTGNWTLVLPIRRLEDFQQMIPDNARFADVLSDHPEASIHPICFDTYEEQATMHGRHCSATGAGSIEDPVTGTASGVMGVYYRQFIQPATTETTIIVEQGHEMGRPGQVGIRISGAGLDHSKWKVEMDGQAVFVGIKKVGEEEADVETFHLGF